MTAASITHGIVVPRPYSEVICAAASWPIDAPVIAELPGDPGGTDRRVAVIAGLRARLTPAGTRLIRAYFGLPDRRDAVSAAIAAQPIGAVVAVATIATAHQTRGRDCCGGLSGGRHHVWHVGFADVSVVPLAVPAPRFPREGAHELPEDITVPLLDQLNRLAAA